MQSKQIPCGLNVFFQACKSIMKISNLKVRNLAQVKATLGASIISSFLVAASVFICLFILMFFIYNRQELLANQREIISDNKLYQASLSEQLGIIASSTEFISFLRSGKYTRKSEVSNLLIRLSSISSPAVTGMTLRDNQNNLLFKTGKVSPYYSVLALCYVGSTLDGVYGDCDYQWTLYFSKSKYVSILNLYNNKVEKNPKSEKTLNLLNNRYFGSFPVLAHSELGVSPNTHKIEFGYVFMIGMIIVIILIALAIWNWYRVKYIVDKLIAYPIEALTTRLKKNEKLDEGAFGGIQEIDYLKEQIVEFKKMEPILKLAEIAAQVAHDIRSPLATLDILISCLQNQALEQERTMMRTAIRRINNIANDLVEKYKGRGNSPETFVFIYSAIKDIVSEKDLECGPKNIKFELSLDSPKTAFSLSRGNYTEIKRMFSNVINNAVNAMPKGGVICVHCVQKNSKMMIQIIDQGCGLSEERIQALLSDRVQENAKIGLGLRHAKDYMRQHEGEISMISEEGVGTTVQLSFPLLPKPAWLCESISVRHSEELIIVDDDASIHDIWTKKLEELPVTRKDFYTPQACRDWFKTAAPKARVILCDYEFVNIPENGLDLLSSLNYQKLRKYLVTSNVDDAKVIAACDASDFELVPKHLLPYVQVLTA